NSLVDPTDSAPLNGELIMSGGTINARWMNLGQLKGNGMAKLSGDAVINIASNVPNDPANGGELSFNRNWFVGGQPVPSSGQVSLDISDRAVINIFGAIGNSAVEPDEGEVDRYQSHVDAGELTAWGGTMDPVLTLQETPVNSPSNHGSFMITITAPAIPGDYNRDGKVNALDYTVWRDKLGAEIVLPGEDPTATTPGLVDQEDHQFWVANYGMGPFDGASQLTSSSAIPEPSAWTLMALGAAILFGRIQRPWQIANR
ncbi:MAG: hypothetical protein ACR2NU_08505, partial [Aeoliella sp.]